MPVLLHVFRSPGCVGLSNKCSVIYRILDKITEQKLHQLKNPSKVTSKNIVSALTEARESQMSTMMNNETTEHSTVSSHQTHSDLNWDDDIAEPRCCCVVVCNHLFPKQAKTTQEVECLLDEDELAIVNSEYADSNLSNQPEIIT